MHTQKGTPRNFSQNRSEVWQSGCRRTDYVISSATLLRHHAASLRQHGFFVHTALHWREDKRFHPTHWRLKTWFKFWKLDFRLLNHDFWAGTDPISPIILLLFFLLRQRSSKKNTGLRLFKSDRDGICQVILQVDMHRLKESDFWYDVIRSRWQAWRNFTSACRSLLYLAVRRLPASPPSACDVSSW